MQHDEKNDASSIQPNDVCNIIYELVSVGFGLTPSELQAQFGDKSLGIYDQV